MTDRATLTRVGESLRGGSVDANVPGSSRYRSKFAALAWGTVAFLVAVILFGAWVRISGSGAGCGESWPTCRGGFIPASATRETWIELSHRLSSALSGLLVVSVQVLAWRLFPRGHVVRRFAALATLFVIIEGAIGAGLVLRGLVAYNLSAARAIVVALHLVNTLLLTLCAALTAAHAPARDMGVGSAGRYSGWNSAWRWGALGALALVASAGAITALGDTLLPVGSARAQASAGHWLVQLRMVHPVLAVLVSLGLGTVAWGCRGRSGFSPKLASIVIALASAQLVQGAANIGLGAPGPMQVLHLALAQALWLACVLLLLGPGERPPGQLTRDATSTAD